MSSEPILVTSYNHPDLDAVACSIGYAELLRAQGKQADPGIFGHPRGEERYIFELFGADYPPVITDVDRYPSIVYTDASDLESFPKQLDYTKVTEIYDHRSVHTAHEFPNAEIHIEPVGSCTTLIAEAFFAAKVDPTPLTAALLYGGILSNTLNFKATVTTDRDHAMADWLQTFMELPADFVHELFRRKSVIKAEDLAEQVLTESAFWDWGAMKLLIVQFEIVDVPGFLAQHQTELVRELRSLASKRGANVWFVSLVALDDHYNRFLTPDAPTQRILETTLDVQFEGDTAQRPGFIMRKQIVPKLKTYLESQ